MSKKKSKLEIAQEEAMAAIKLTNDRIQILGEHSGELYKSLVNLQELFDRIRHVPSEQMIKLEKIKNIRLSWKQQADRIAEENASISKKAISGGASGVLAGIGVAALGPTAAMGVATTFGVASTGTAISALSGAAATNAALAWLGGGALAAGGGGMAAGQALLTLAGPVGWGIAGAALLASGIFFFVSKSKNDRLQDIFTLISKRDVKSYELAIVELNERIERMKDETPKLWEASALIKSFGLNYSEMTEEQQYTLGAYVNLMYSSTQLLVNPILGLLPKYTKNDLDELISKHTMIYSEEFGDVVKTPGQNKYWDSSCCIRDFPNAVISLANLLYSIELDTKDKEVLAQSFKKNEDFLKSMGLTRKQFDDGFIFTAMDLLKFKAMNK